MVNRQSRLGIAGLVALTLLALGVPEPAAAQLGLRNRGEDFSQEQILLAPRALSRLLREGKTAIDEMRYSDGIAALGAILLEEVREDLPPETVHQDYFTEPGGDRYYKTSVRGEALRLLGAIPEEGRKTLEIQYGVQARQALEAAVASRDIEAIAEVTRKFYHTEAGYDASVLLANDKLVRGFPIAAAGILERLSEYPAARKRFGGQLIAEIVSAWMQADRKDLALRALERGATAFAGQSLILAGRQVALDDAHDWGRLLDQAFPRSRDARQQSLANWLMTGGEPTRNGTAAAGLPLPTVAWDLTLHRDRSDEEVIRSLSQREAQASTVLLPKLEARMQGDTVLTKTAAGNIFAVDLNTGLRMWPFYKDGLPLPLASRVSSIPTDTEEALMHTALRNRVWANSAFGQFTVDNNQLYFITTTEEQKIVPTVMGRGSAAPVYNMMIGVSLQAQGKEVWQVGGEKSEHEPALAGAYFLGPPLSFEGALYALVEINMETRLVVLDARTGKLQWSQQLTLSTMAPIRNDPLRQSQALSPSISDSIVVCPVGNGAVIAVDLLTRSLLWGKQYATTSRLPNVMNQFGNLNDAIDSYDASEERWQEPQVIIYKGKVIFTPPESSIIMCIDLLTGVRLWEQARQNYRYVAGVANDQIIVVSNTHVFAMNLEGRPCWPADVSIASRNAPGKPPQEPARRSSSGTARETVAGKSVRDGKYLYVPTSHQRVLKIDLEAGKLVDWAEVEQPLGNLFAHKNRLISVGPARIDVYFTREALAEEVDQRLAANPNDTWALNHRSLIYMADGRVPEAIEVLRKSFAIDPKDGETRYMLVNALMSGLEQDFNGYLSIATELEPIIESQHFRFLLLLARGNLRSGQYELAFNRLMELVRERTRSRQPTLQTRVETMTLSPGYEVDIDTWIATQLGVAFAKATAEERTRMLKLVEDRLASMGGSHPLTRETELRFLAWIETAQPWLMNLAEGMLGDTDQTVAERLLQPALYSNSTEIRTRAESLLSRNTRADSEAMISHREQVFVRPDGIVEAVRGAPVAIPTQQQWPTGMIEAQVQRSETPIPFIQSRLKQTGTRYGRPNVDIGLAHDQLIVLSQLGNPLGTMVYERGVNDGVDNFLRCQIDGGLVFLETQSELLAFDMYRGHTSPADARLWRVSLLRTPINSRSQHNPASPHTVTSPLGFKTYTRGVERESTVGPVTPSGILIQKGAELIMLDALTGNELWTRGGYDDRTTLAAEGIEVAVIHPRATKIDILDCRDGSLTRQIDLSGDWNSWFVSGKHVVQTVTRESKSRKGGIQLESQDASALRVLDAFTGKIVTEREFAPGSSADSYGDRYLVALQESGDLWYCDVETGLSRDLKLPPQPKLDRVRLQQFGERLIVMSSLSTTVGNVNVIPSPDEAKGLFAVNGSVAAINAGDGTMCWDRVGTLSRFVFPASQPRFSPYVTFFRVIVNTGSRQAHLAVVDLRDGTLAYANNSMNMTNQTNNREGIEFGMDVVPEKSELRISVANYHLKLTATDTIPPPQPVVHYGAIPTTRRTVAQETNLFTPPQPVPPK